MKFPNPFRTLSEWSYRNHSVPRAFTLRGICAERRTSQWYLRTLVCRQGLLSFAKAQRAVWRSLQPGHVSIEIRTMRLARQASPETPSCLAPCDDQERLQFQFQLHDVEHTCRRVSGLGSYRVRSFADWNSSSDMAHCIYTKRVSACEKKLCHLSRFTSCVSCYLGSRFRFRDVFEEQPSTAARERMEAVRETCWHGIVVLENAGSQAAWGTTVGFATCAQFLFGV